MVLAVVAPEGDVLSKFQIGQLEPNLVILILKYR